MRFAIHIVVDGHGIKGLHRFSLEAASLEDALAAICDWADEGGYTIQQEHYPNPSKVYPVDLGWWLEERARVEGDAGRAA